MVSGDRIQLQQVIMNMVLNAADAMRQISSRQRHLKVRTSFGAHGILVEVVDSGEGIPEHSFPRLFDPFFTTKANGMGIGLSVSRSIIESHGGRIWGSNNKGNGATFAFAIPAFDTAENVPDGGTSSHAREKGPSDGS